MNQKPGVITGILERPAAFAGVFVTLFIITFGFLLVVDAVPEPVGSKTPLGTGPAVVPATPEPPVRVAALDIGLDSSVENPVTTSIPVLDEALLRGAVRYPTSAVLGEEGTVLLFGHSSYLPVVRNQAYKTFDGIQDLKVGEVVSVYSATTEYRYKVTGVRVGNAEEDIIPLIQEGRHLILVTCNSFATKSSRFIVSADFAGAYSL